MIEGTLCGIPVKLYRPTELSLMPDFAQPKMTILDEQGKPYNANNEMYCALFPNGDKVWLNEAMSITPELHDTCRKYWQEKWLEEMKPSWQRREVKVEWPETDHQWDSLRYGTWTYSRFRQPENLFKASFVVPPP